MKNTCRYAMYQKKSISVPERQWKVKQVSPEQKQKSTIHRPTEVIAPKSIRQFGKLTSAERRITTTIISCINAVGNSTPPILISTRHSREANLQASDQRVDSHCRPLTVTAPEELPVRCRHLRRE
ncbi:hypothetical protein EVAR_39242_1 [Eumeta japonica]|uniref:Uncharacterized protein n=1 Tax=Eumeta variegata TaxID=151549 RepID=A0A4C1XYE9_EUMVA|nr:hypothetical protein EVAR_39242_1 [Eumeta japonica]